MAELGDLEGLEHLHRNLLAQSQRHLSNVDGDVLTDTEPRLPSIERLWFQLETRVEEFRNLLEKKPRNNESRKCLETGKIKIMDEEYAVNEVFNQGTLQVADALNLDELQSARIFLEAQNDADLRGWSVVECSIIRFHQTRKYVLDCLRLILQMAADVNLDENLRDNFQVVVAEVLQSQGNPSNGPKFVKRCLQLMAEVKTWLQNLADKVSSASVLGQAQPEFSDTIEYQRISLIGQHESLGVIVHYLVKGNQAGISEFEHVLGILKRADRYDNLLVHYFPATAAFITLLGSPEGAGSLRQARILSQKVIGNREQDAWTLHYVHAAVCAWWLGEYSGWYTDNSNGSPLVGVDLDEETKSRAKSFTDSLTEGAFDFILSLSADVKSSDWQDPARQGLRQWLQRKAPPLVPDTIHFSDFFQEVLMEHLESFIDAFITNMPDILRKLRVDEDEQRQLSQTHEHDLDLERFLVIISFAFDGRPDAAQAFWLDPDSNLAGFLHWASRRASTPLVSAFCEMLQALSGDEQCATAAHHFLLDEGAMSSGKMRRSHSLTWSQIIKELEFFSSKIRDRPALPQSTSFRSGKQDIEQAETEPEFAMMLESYLRLIGRLCYQSSTTREFFLKHPSFNITELLFQLAGSLIPSRLRACAFNTLRSLLSQKTKSVADFIWTSLDSWICGGYSLASQMPKTLTPVAIPAWAMGGIFQEIGNGFEEPNAFIQLLNVLIEPCEDESRLDGILPFPETLGLPSRTPGIDPFVDFAVGQIFGSKSPEVIDHISSRLLNLTCLQFITSCLENFNEDLVIFANQSGVMVDRAIKTSDLATYIRLHPFSRVMEWIFNDKVMSALFAVVHEEVGEVAKAAPDSPLVLRILQSIHVISLVMELQATYLDVVRPIVKLQPAQRRAPVANAAFATFEDGVLNNLSLVVDLGLYCGAGHSSLTVASLKLLEKLSTAPKLASPTSFSVGGRLERNKIIASLESNNDTERISRSLVGEFESNIEMDLGSDSPSYLTKIHILDFLNACLEATPGRPTLAHLLLGFQCGVDTVEISPDSLFGTGNSLFHSIMSLAMECPVKDESESMSAYLICLKNKAVSVLQSLWRSPLTSDIVMDELRAHEYLSHMAINEVIVGPDTQWDDRSIEDKEFGILALAPCVSYFINYRVSLFQYAASALRLVSQDPSTALKLQISGTLLGSTTMGDGQQIQNSTVFDWFDFMELDIYSSDVIPQLTYFNDIDTSVCMDNSAKGPPTYNLKKVRELLMLRRNELHNLGQLQSSEQVDAAETEINQIAAYFLVQNQVVQLNTARLKALEAWAQLVMMMVDVGGLDGTNKLRTVLEAILILQSKLEKYSYQSLEEALILADLAKFLVYRIDFKSQCFKEDDVGQMANDRLFQLFGVCLRAIQSPIGNTQFKETLYGICYRYLTNISEVLRGSMILRKDSVQTVKTAGERLLAVVCEDAYAGEQTCRIAALLFLSGLVVLARQEDSKYIVETLIRLNFIGLLVDSLSNILGELSELHEEKEVDLHLSYYSAKLALLLHVSQTRFGATAVLNAGLFQTVKESRTFSRDPDIGIDIDGSSAVRKHYELLVGVMRVINSAVLSRGSQNEQTLSQARKFLSENRLSVLTVFKRSAKLVGDEESSFDESIDDLTELYMLLISMSGFLEFDDDTIVNKPSTFKSFA